MNFEPNTLYYGDCLEVMSLWPSDCVDLIYLDPPFNSDTDYNILYGTESAGRQAQVLAFSDTWEWDRSARERVRLLKKATAHEASRVIRGLEIILGESGMLAYVSYMAERLVLLKRILKPSGSIFLHCDDNASQYLRTLMDAIFSPHNFRNHIAWRRAVSHNDPRRFGRIQDHILFYANGEKPYWAGDRIAQAKSAEELIAAYPSCDERGRYRSDNLTGPLHNTSAGRPSTTPWRGYDVFKMGRCWSVPKTGRYARYIERHFIPGYRSIEGIHDRLNALDEAGLIHHPERGKWPGIKRYATADTGNPPQDIVLEPIGFTNFTAQHGEYLGYPTQKPVALLEKLLKAGSDENDLVLDPFCGCGTTVAAAHNLGRRWLGIDISPFAIDLIVKRRFQGMKINTSGIPVDMEGAEKLAKDKPFDFERWAVTRIPGLLPNTRQVGDSGIDGEGHLVLEPDGDYETLVLAQVKGGKYSLSQLRDFLHTVNRENAAFGIFITLNSLLGRQRRNAEKELASTGELKVGASTYPRVQLWSLEDYFNGMKPQLPDMTDPFTGRALPEEMQIRFY